MRKLYVRFGITILLVVVLSSMLATFLTFLLLLVPSTAPTAESMFHAMRLRGLLFPVLTVAISALAIALASKKAVSPIVALSDAAQQIARGNLEATVKVSRRRDEIGDLERNFALMAKELRSNELMRKDFIANISHEFKTPLSIIEGYAQLVAEPSVGDEERIQYARIIQSESEHLRRLSSNILRLSRLDSQTLQGNRATFPLDEQIRQVILLLEPKWGKRGISFDISMGSQVYYGDEELLSQAWLNLIENAVKFSHDGGCIIVRMEAVDDALEIDITDGGPGMDEETRARAFEQFFQGEASRNTEGSGLGLAIVKRIVDLHEGEVRLDSSPGCGTTVSVKLPVFLNGGKR